MTCNWKKNAWSANILGFKDKWFYRSLLRINKKRARIYFFGHTRQDIIQRWTRPIRAIRYLRFLRKSFNSWIRFSDIPYRKINCEKINLKNKQFWCTLSNILDTRGPSNPYVIDENCFMRVLKADWFREIRLWSTEVL